MKPVLIVLVVVLIAALALIGRGFAAREEPALAPLPPERLPAGGIELLEARAFVVDEPFVHEWRAEKPLVNSGCLLVLEVDAELARTRETYEPVLYVGEQTAERCNLPVQGDVLVVLVPASLDAQGRVALDLDSAPIWFGSLELPERVDAARIAGELAAARARGIGPARMAPGAALRTGAQEAIRARTRWELEPYVEDLITQYSAR